MNYFIAAQKTLLHLARRQNEIVLNGVRERVSGSTASAAMTDLLRRSVDTFIDLQTHFLDVAAKQSEAWVHSAKSGKPFEGQGLADLAREGMEHFVASQRKFLDVVVEETEKATKGRNGTSPKEEVTELSELARRSVDAFIEAQKKLLDTASEQMHAGLKTTGKVLNSLSPASSPGLGELTRKGVESFVAAQRSLLDVMTRPRTTAVHAHVPDKPKAAARRAHAAAKPKPAGAHAH
jgi:hypothetical protein